MQTQTGLINLAHVSYGIDPLASDEINSIEAREPGSIIFSGTMDHPPNVDAAIHFVVDIFPTVIEHCASAKLWIVGANPDPRILSATKRFGDRVRVTGKVEDIGSYIRRARVSICPVRLKIGVQTKILEAMSCGTPVVTTEAGNSGIGAVSGRHLWVDDDPALFARHIVELLNGKGWTEFSNAGNEFVGGHNNWATSITQLEQVIDMLIVSRKKVVQ
jgi:glycosyltransferase involved in cell wall biosynthesis